MEQPAQNYQKLIAGILGSRPIAYNPDLAKIAQSTTAGILLSQLLYWSDKTEDGWIYKSNKDIEGETGLTRREQDTAIKALKSKNIISVKVKGSPPVRYFKADIKHIIELLSQLHGSVQSIAPFGAINHEDEILDSPDRLHQNVQSIAPKRQMHIYNTEITTLDSSKYVGSPVFENSIKKEEKWKTCPVKKNSHGLHDKYHECKDPHDECNQYLHSIENERHIGFADYNEQMFALHDLLKAGYDFDDINSIIKQVEAKRGKSQYSMKTVKSWADTGAMPKKKKEEKETVFFEDGTFITDNAV